MLGACTIKPDWTFFGRNQDSPTIVDVYLIIVGKIQFMIRNPEPGVLEICGCLRGDMEKHIGADTSWVCGGSDRRVLGAGVGLQLGSSRSTNTEVDIPQASGALRSLLNVPLHHNCTGLRANCLKHQVRHLDRSNITDFTNLEDRLWVILVLECAGASCHNEWPNFASDSDVLRDLDCACDNIGSVVEIDDICSADRVEESLDGSCIVSDTVTLCSCGLDTLESRNGLLLILWL